MGRKETSRGSLPPQKNLLSLPTKVSRIPSTERSLGTCPRAEFTSSKQRHERDFERAGRTLVPNLTEVQRVAAVAELKRHHFRTLFDAY